jgi:hypothetical protein
MATKDWNRENLIKAFRAMGAADPEALAASQLENGVPELPRFAFLKRLWDQVADPTSTKWITQTIEQAEKWATSDQAEAGRALRRMMAAGVDPTDILKVVWYAQAEMIYNVAFQLDDPEFAVAQLPQHGGMEEDDATWGLFTVDADGEPGVRIDSLHEVWGSIVPAPKWPTEEPPTP